MNRRALLALAASAILLAHARGASTQPPPAASAPLAPAAAGAPALPGLPHDHVPELEAAMRAMIHDSVFANAQVGVAILDVDSGHLLAASNEHLPLNPASNAKVFTAAAALSTLHGNHRYETTLSGPAKEGEIAGHLVLRGHGDPSLTTADLWNMVHELRAQGIRRINGDILVDNGFFDETTTPPAFEQKPEEWAAFRAPISGVAVNENTVTLSVRPTSAGQPANVSFDPPGFVDVDGTVITGEGADTVVLALTPNGKRLSAKVAGAVGGDARVVRYTRRVDDPSLLAGYVLKHLVDTAGIKVTGEVKAGTAKGSPLVRHQSAPLSSLLYALGKQSDNFYAEMIFKSLGGELKARPASSADGGEVVSRWLSRIGAMEQGMVVKNGSGLYDANRSTALSFVQVLRAAWRDPSVQPEFLAQLAVGGVDGTLHKRFRTERTRRHVRAKTGTLDDVIALSGYVLSPGGKGPVAFSILFNKVAGHASSARQAADKLVDLIARRTWGS